MYAAQEIAQTDAEIAEKGRFETETRLKHGKIQIYVEASEAE
jgi:hypothetical protein